MTPAWLMCLLLGATFGPWIIGLVIALCGPNDPPAGGTDGA